MLTDSQTAVRSFVGAAHLSQPPAYRKQQNSAGQAVVHLALCMLKVWRHLNKVLRITFAAGVTSSVHECLKTMLTYWLALCMLKSRVCKVLRVALDAEMSFPVHAYLNTAPTRWLVCAGLVFKSVT